MDTLYKREVYMERFEVTGGAPLCGAIKISGAKNEALKVIPLAVLVGSEFEIQNIPDIADIRTQLEIFKGLGGKYKFTDNVLRLDGAGINNSNLAGGLATKLRASIVYAGVLLARFKTVTIPFPGGCAIGRRPIDTHIQAFVDFGAKLTKDGDNYILNFENFQTKSISLIERSVTATENVLMFLSGFNDEFVVKNCAIEPEIEDLVRIINNAGATIKRNDRTFTIRGNNELRLTQDKIIPDRIEAFSYLVAFIVTGGSGTIDNFPADYMKKPLEVLKKCKAKFKISRDKLEVLKNDQLESFQIKTGPYPGFPTDMQSPMSLIAAKAQGRSQIEETMFENRLGYIKELKKMGLQAEVKDKQTVEIVGGNKLKGADIDSLDLRSGITLILGALMAGGISTINNAQIIDRGYENIILKLTKIGALVKRK